MPIQVFEGDGVDHQLRHVGRAWLYPFRSTLQHGVLPDLGEVEPKLLDELHAFCTGAPDPLVLLNLDRTYACFLQGLPHPGINARFFLRGPCGHCHLKRYAGRSRTVAALHHLARQIRLGNAAATDCKDWDLNSEPVTVDGEPLLEFLARSLA